MAGRILFEPSRALAEFRLLPGLTTTQCAVDKVALRTRLTRFHSGNGFLHCNAPILGAAMQAVSGVEMGIALARAGGLAFIYASQPIDRQAVMVERIKQHKAGFVRPQTVSVDFSINEVRTVAQKSGFSTFPVIDDEGRLLGLITDKDYEVGYHDHLTVRDRMIPRDELLVGVNVPDLRTANEILVNGHHGVLPVVDAEDRLLYLVFRKDIRNHLDHPLELVDQEKRLLAGAAINSHDHEQRVPALVKAGVDVLTIDSSDGYSEYQKETLTWIAARFPEVPVIAGNIVTAEGFRFLADAGAHAVKIGMGGGSICITQEQKGTGRGLGTAIVEVARERDRYEQETGRYLPLIADGGIVTAKDMVVALALGANAVMLGRYLARMDESPTDKVVINNRVMKPYWGEGSPRAREWRQARYAQSRFAEGVEGYVEYAGPLRDNLDETLSIIRSTLSTCGVATIDDLHRQAVVEVVSGLSIREGQVHDIFMPTRDMSTPSQSWGN